MNCYTKGLCPRYSVSFKSGGTGYFTITDGDNARVFEIDLSEKGLWTGKEAYTQPHPGRHFICHEDGELIATPDIYRRLILVEWIGDVPKTFIRARQWEFDWWMSIQFPDSANAKVYQMIKNFTKNF